VILEQDPVYGELTLDASAAELSRLADAVTLGSGRLDATTGPGGNTLTGVEVSTTPGPGVLLHVDAARQVLLISGDAGARAVLAANLRAMAEEEDGGHLHIDYYPDHFYLAEGSVPLVVNSPHGGMPTGRTS
jgi:hypothetical protein